MVNSFSEHLQSIYELEMFYGDDTVRSLLDHALSFNEQLETFEYIYSLTQEQQEKNKNDAEETDEDENLYSEDYLLKDLISNIDIPEGGINDSRYLADSFEVTLTEEATHIE